MCDRGDDFGYSVFASQRIIDMIEQNYTEEQRKYAMDATFLVVPLLFFQLLIIYFETPTKQVTDSYIYLFGDKLNERKAVY